MNTNQECTFPRCLRPSYARGYCKSHHAYLMSGRELTPLPGSPDYLTYRFWQRVDISGECWLWTRGTSRGYGIFGMEGGQRLAHRVAYEWANGPIPPGMDIDHICQNRACVNVAHLRIATRMQNIENHTGPRRDSSSGVRGVRQRRTKSGRWEVNVRSNNRRYYVGTFDTIEQAEAAAIAKRNELHTFNDRDRRTA